MPDNNEELENFCRYDKEKKPEQTNLFDEPELLLEPEWKKEWKDMPEFIQERQTPFSEIVIRFSSQEDMEDFSKIIGQKINKKTTYTPCLWHPKLVPGAISRTRYIDDENNAKDKDDIGF